ncbi:MAG: ribosome recycling factor, partial [Chitinophagales bacterium]|nr:ribosome recycling factor [Chitinophagales bacterium]
MIEEIDSQIQQTRENFDKAIEHLVFELNKIRAGKASPAMVSGVMVDYYGTPTPLNQVANITTPDARTISIQPWEKKMLAGIEKGIFEANLG